MYKYDIDMTQAHRLEIGITLPGGVSRTLTARTVQHTSSVCASDGISIGNVCPASVTIELDQKIDLLNQIIHVTAAFDYEVHFGYFRVTECRLGDYSTTLTAYDALYWATGGHYIPSVGENPTVKDVLEDIAQQVGVGLEVEHAPDLDNDPTVWGYGYAERLHKSGTHSGDGYVKAETLEEKGVIFTRYTATRDFAVAPSCLILPEKIEREYPSGSTWQNVYISAKIRANNDGPSISAGLVNSSGSTSAGDLMSDRTVGEWRICHLTKRVLSIGQWTNYGLLIGNTPVGQTESGAAAYLRKGDSFDIQWMVVTCGEGADFIDLDGGVPSPVITAPLTGYTLREMLGYMAGLMGKNAILSRNNLLKLRWFDDGAKPDGYYADGLNIRGDYQLTGITAHVPKGDAEELLTAGSGTGMGIDITNPFMTQELLDGIWERIGGLIGQLGSVSIPYGMENEAGDIIQITDVSGKASRLIATSVTLSMDGGCKADIAGDGASASEQGAVFQGALGSAIARLQADIIEVRSLIAEAADIKNLTVDVANIRGVLKSINYSKAPIPLIYPSETLQPSETLFPSDGSEVVTGYMIDFTNGVVEGAFYDKKVADLEERVRRLEEERQTPMEVNEDEL